MKCLKQYNYIYRQSSLLLNTSHHSYRSLIIPSCYNINTITTKYEYIPLNTKRSFCTSSDDKSAGQRREEELRQQFAAKYQRKIQTGNTEAMSRYASEIEPQQTAIDHGGTVGSQQSKQQTYGHVFGIPRATFRGIFLMISCLIGATCFVILRPSPIVKYT